MGYTFFEATTITELIKSNDPNVCNTVRTIRVKVESSIRTSTQKTICSSELPFNWNGRIITAAGVYQSSLKNVAGCDSISTLTLKVTSSPKLVITNPASVCAPETIDLTSSYITSGSDLGLTFTYWLDSAATKPLDNPNRVSTSGIYYIKASTSGTCSSIKSVAVNIIVYDSQQGIRYSTKYTQQEVPVKLNARDLGKQFSWFPGIGLSTTSAKDPTFKYDRDVEYTVSIRNENNCLIIDTVMVKVELAQALPIRSDIFVPKAWTPNNDGHNDALKPLPVNIAELKFFRIFNRWGELVFETKTLGKGWNGIHKGKPHVMDVFTWTLEAVGMDGQYFKKSGNSVLIR
jgi:gliding motility-associated-like protein